MRLRLSDRSRPGGVQAAGPRVSGESGQLIRHAAQPFTEVLGTASEPEAEVSLEAEIAAGDDQRAAVAPDPLAQIGARHARLVLHQADRSRLRLDPGEPRSEARHPRAHRVEV